jgi:Mce-associated membrane protein
MAGSVSSPDAKVDRPSEADEEPPEETGLAAPERSDRSVRRFIIGTALLVLVLVGTLVGGTLLTVSHVRASDRRGSDADAVTVGRDVVTRLSSLSAQGIDQQVNDLLAESTGSFRQQLTGTLQLLQSLTGNARFASQGQVTSIGVESNDGRRAVVLATAVSQVSNVQIPQGAQRRYKLVATLQWDGSRWLVDSVEAPA